MIEAQQTLLSLRVADWPNMKKTDREKWHRELHRMAYPKTWNRGPQKVVTTDELARMLGVPVGEQRN